MNLRNINVTHVVGDPRLVSELRPLLAGAGASRFSSVIVLCDITWTVRTHIAAVEAQCHNPRKLDCGAAVAGCRSPLPDVWNSSLWHLAVGHRITAMLLG